MRKMAENQVKADYSDATPDIERTYPRVGYLAMVSDAAGVRSFTYDAHFNLTGETLGNRTLTYTYATTGVKGRYTGLTGNHTYGYDQYGRINSDQRHRLYPARGDTGRLEHIPRHIHKETSGVNAVFPVFPADLLRKNFAIAAKWCRLPCEALS